MEKDELLDRIRKGELFLQRTDITDKQREAAGERYSNLVAQLGVVLQEEEAAAKEAPPEAPEIDPKVRECMDAIRDILGPKKAKP